MAKLEMTITCKKRFWFMPVLMAGAWVCFLLRRESLPEWFIVFIVNYGMKVKIA